MLVAPVRVGRGSVTGAGSVVIKDAPPDSLLAGVPAQVKKNLKE
jgi:bifunctional UDP-N-acetylglucosamine pyrophosphorylase/glucosamine-1-phosphate N-acetyltransferase